MAPPAPPPVPVSLICGDDEFAVKERSRQVYQLWLAEVHGFDHEIIDASAANSAEALAALARLREGLQTLPFFSGGKVIWFQNCNFLGEDRTATSEVVNTGVTDLAQELKTFSWRGVRLLISAGKVDKRKTFYKTIDKLGAVEHFAAWSTEDRDWSMEAETVARRKLRELKKEISEEALAQLVANVGPNARLLSSEIEKLSLFLGNRSRIEPGDIAAIVTQNKQARAFALGDAFGARDLPRVLQRLDEELWAMKFDSQRTEIGLLYGLISKVRVLILLKEMLQQDIVRRESDYNRFKAQLQRIPAETFPQDRRFNPLAMNAYVLFKGLGHVDNYSRHELVHAMELLLRCNLQLVLSSLDDALVLQQTLIEIVSSAETPFNPPDVRT